MNSHRMHGTARCSTGCLPLQAVQVIHQARIVHADLKPANFLMVEGQLKLIDFGIAKAIHGDTTSISRESQASCCALPSQNCCCVRLLCEARLSGAVAAAYSCCPCLTPCSCLQVGTLNYMAPETILSGPGNEGSGSPPVKVSSSH